MPADTTIPVSDEVWTVLMRQKQRGDSFDDVLRRLLQLDNETAEDDTGTADDQDVSEPDDDLGALAEAIADWQPDTQANPDRAREETRRAVAWLQQQDEPQKRKQIVAACAGESDVGERTWWERCVQPGLRHLAENGLVEFRPGYHDYAIS